jgi:hypothetical protein
MSAQSSPYWNFTSFSYQVVEKVHYCARATHVAKKRLGESGKLRSRDFACSRFITDGCKDLLNYEKLSLWSSDSAQIFQYGEAVLVGPVVQYFGDDEDRDVLLPCWLWRKEVVALRTQMSVLCQPREGGGKN